MRKITLLILCFIWIIDLMAQNTSPKKVGDDYVTLYSKNTVKETTDTVIKKKNIFRKINDYFQSSNEDKTLTKKFDWSIIGGPHYSSDIKLGLGLVAAGLYRVDRDDLSIPPSNVSLFGDVTTTGFYMLGIRGNTFFKGAKYRLDYTSYFYSMPAKYWGIGYEHGAARDSFTTYDRDQSQIKVDFLYRVFKDAYVGATAGFNYVAGKKFEKPEYLNGEKDSYISSSLGLILMYDSRDIITNAYEGWYLRFEQNFFPSFMGNKMAFSRSSFFANHYNELWKGAVLASEVHGEFNYGDVPWTQVAMLGNSYRMRGYYEGQYRDRNILEAQIELRQKIWRRNGIAVWVGAGNVFHSFNRFKWSHTLPNYGVGYRWEFKKRMNVRLDLGFGKKETGFIFSINEAF
ncbi:MAG TPA: hypothetical protein DCF91_08505 [Porphyromonadaceae bacterium]|nr:hypothetical protein [Porphyromonadaceae bacterium]